MVDIKFRLPKDIPLEEYPKPETYIEEARRLTEEAQKSGIFLRVMGPIALHFYFPEYVDLYRRLERLGERVFTDIDYASYGKNKGKMIAFFNAQGYHVEKRALMMSGGARHIYFSERIPMIDVFFDELNYNHPIKYKGRLEIHPYCVSLTDLLLQKLQIVKINDKDIKDILLLLLAATVGESDHGMVNAKYVAALMADDWGFYHTSTANLMKVKEFSLSVGVLTTESRATIQANTDRILDSIERAPKSGKWKKRENIGTKKAWYNEVTDWG
jgi:hypothetical protein